MPETLGHTTTPQPAKIYYPGSSAEKDIIYPEQREDDMGETSIHITLVLGLLSVLKLYFKQDTDVFVTGNMNLYYEEGNPNKWLAPDVLIAFGIDNHNRSSYQIWKEQICPQVIFEVSSQRTWKTDIGEKLEIYSELGVEEYYNLDPEFEYLPAPMLAYHRLGERLLAVPVKDGRVSSPRLGLEVVRTENSFRLFDPESGEFLRTLEESETELARLRSEIEKLKAER